MTARRIIIALTVLIAAVWLTGCMPGQFGGTQGPATSVTCHEEDPCWNPATMGNGLGHL